jgi:hypothetical protein
VLGVVLLSALREPHLAEAGRHIAEYACASRERAGEHPPDRDCGESGDGDRES